MSLDNFYYDLGQKKIIYRFKSFGDHSFPKFSYDVIQNTNDILYSINPQDLIKISIQEHIHKSKHSMSKVTELLRDNKYKICDELSEGIFTGEEICDNPLLIEKLNNIDLYKIAYNTGFQRGRSITKLAAHEVNQDNVVSLTIMHNEM